jgi:hypothetical protein
MSPKGKAAARVTDKKVSTETSPPAQSELSLGIKNFGPISSGQLQIKPLTVLIGPNNSGKSYVAMLTNSLFNINYLNLSPHHPPLIEPDDKTLRDNLLSLAPGQDLDLTGIPKRGENILRERFSSAFSESLRNTFSDCPGSA